MNAADTWVWSATSAQRSTFADVVLRGLCDAYENGNTAGLRHQLLNVRANIGCPVNPPIPNDPCRCWNAAAYGNWEFLVTNCTLVDEDRRIARETRDFMLREASLCQRHGA